MTKVSDLPNLDPYYNSLSSVQFVANAIEEEDGDYITGKIAGETLSGMLLSGVVYYNYLSSESYILYKASDDDNYIYGVPPDYIRSFVINDSSATGDFMQYYPIVATMKENQHGDYVPDEISAYHQSIGDILSNLPEVGDYQYGTSGGQYLVWDVNNHRLGYAEFDAFKFDLYAALFYNGTTGYLPRHFDAEDLNGNFAILATSTLQGFDDYQQYGVIDLDALYDYFQSRSSSPE